MEINAGCLNHFCFVFLEPVNFYNTSVQLSEYPTVWTPGGRVRVLWNSKELADQPVTIDIINLVEHLGTIQVHSNITVVSEQENTGKSEFNLPDLDNIRSVVPGS